MAKPKEQMFWISEMRPATRIRTGTMICHESKFMEITRIEHIGRRVFMRLDGSAATKVVPKEASLMVFERFKPESI